MKAKVLKLGFVGGKRVWPGQVIEVSLEAYSPKWMESMEPLPVQATETPVIAAVVAKKPKKQKPESL